jgi:hypothetical protein
MHATFHSNSTTKKRKKKQGKNETDWKHAQSSVVQQCTCLRKLRAGEPVATGRSDTACASFRTRSSARRNSVAGDDSAIFKQHPVLARASGPPLGAGAVHGTKCKHRFATPTTAYLIGQMGEQHAQGAGRQARMGFERRVLVRVCRPQKPQRSQCNYRGRGAVRRVGCR